MAYQVTYTTTFQANAVPYDEWVASQNPSTLAEYGSPNPTVVFEDQIKLLDPANGFISEEKTENDNTITISQLWESEELYNSSRDRFVQGTGTITKVDGSTTISGTGTSFTTELSVGAELYNCFTGNGHGLHSKVVSIESDTSLTVDPAFGSCTNAAFDFKDASDVSREATTNALYNLYASTNIVSSNTTYANV